MIEVDVTLPSNHAHRWFRRFGTCVDARRRLFCFHHAGGGPSLFRAWQQHVSPHTEVLAVAMPGRETRFAEPPLHRMDRLAEQVVEAMPLDLPFAFFGHSLGGVVSFEVAHQLNRLGLPMPQRLFISASPAPHDCLKEKSRGALSDLELLHTLQTFGGTPSQILQHPDYVDMLVNILRADFDLIDRYVPTANNVLRLPITAYAGDSDLHITPAKMSAWQHWAMSDFTCRSFQGDHFYLNEQRMMLIDDLLGRWSDATAYEMRHSA